MSPRPRQAIVGLGLTAQGRVFDHGYVGFAASAVELALADAGLRKQALDGLLVNPGLSWSNPAMASATLQQALGLRDLRLSASMNIGGATACAMIQHACLAITAGVATTVACVFSDAPIKAPRPGDKARRSTSYSMARGWDASFGYFGVNPRYAMIAKRHMHVYGTTQDQLGRVATTQRDWARDNPAAEMRERPLSLDDYHASRWIVEPFHVHDCCLVSNGGACVIVTDAERARGLRRPLVPVLGYGQGHPGSDPLETLSTGATVAGPTAFELAGLAPADVDLAELYDCYTFTVLVTLEDYGFCAKGEAGRFVESGATARGGTLPVNTGGGQLSSFYMWGMTPVVEAGIQLRGDGGHRQVDGAEVALVSGNGGILATHSCLILGSEHTA
ncbi:MAG TPA: thiolase family protein [Candidatus Binatia bacterium]|nr:thiolase family protein [Candidatus Binatia bacterium]